MRFRLPLSVILAAVLGWLLVLVAPRVQAAEPPLCYPTLTDPVTLGAAQAPSTRQTVRWVAWWCVSDDGWLRGYAIAGVSEVQFRAAFNTAMAAGFDAEVVERLWRENVTGSPVVDEVRPVVVQSLLKIKPQRQP
jgi:hypothetical protein